jgi:hypothetical protein
VPAEVAEVAIEVPASTGQRLLWIADHYRGVGGTFNMPLLWRFYGPLDVAALRHALDELVARHESLRTTVVRRGRHLVQVVHDRSVERLEVLDMSGSPDAEALVAAAAARETARRVDVSRWPWRGTVWRIAPEDHVVCIVVHHAVTDHHSSSRLGRDLRALYERTVGWGAAELPPVEWQYRHWSEWQRRRFEDGWFDELVSFWRDRLQGMQLPVLPPKRASSTPSGTEMAAATFAPSTVTRLRALAIAERTTVFVVALAAFYAYLSSLDGQRDLVVGSMFRNRTRVEVLETVGYFVNVVLLRTRLDDRETFLDLVRRTRSTVLDALEHQELPYHMLPSEAGSRLEDGARRSDDVVFQLLEVPERESFAGLRVQPQHITARPPLLRSPFELALWDDGNRLGAQLLTESARFTPDSCAAWLADYERTLSAATARPDGRLADVRRAASRS